jgi:hypothetical protein
MTEKHHNKRLSEVFCDAKCPRCNSNDKLLHLLEIIVTSDADANIVGTNGLKAGVQV